MDKDYKKIINLFSRYIAILILGIGNLYIIYKILTPLTIFTTNLVIRFFTTTTLIENTIRFSQVTIEIAPACIAGSAFYLLLSLILSTADIKPKTRAYAILTAVTAFFILNVARILILSSITSLPNFETIHWIFWHIVSTLFVVVVYIVTIRFYKIKGIPFHSDIKYLKSLSKRKKK